MYTKPTIVGCYLKTRTCADVFQERRKREEQLGHGLAHRFDHESPLPAAGRVEGKRKSEEAGAQSCVDDDEHSAHSRGGSGRQRRSPNTVASTAAGLHELRDQTVQDSEL